LASAPQLTLLVDGECGVCCWGGIQIAARVPALAVSTIQLHLDAELAGLDAERALASWHLVGPAMQPLGGADVIVEILIAAGRPRAAATATMLLPLLRPAYRLAAASRPLWAKLVPAERRAWARERLASASRMQVRRPGRVGA